MEDGKKPWLSKTLWFAVIAALVERFAPGILTVVQGNEVTVMAAVAFILRLVTKDKIVLASRKSK